ncbi:hypothetical protein ACWGH8_08575 [Nonomuraea muscovyensis]|uniref:Uncharacterized protein n=1 Tax=Nonomuraea muscovyensis TaxID=1124761 RepID=A0A7X0EXL4_9ACTN|nr:hypothetical protein [Nonomuraea muscovyensis]MBB6345484.1 hypothetical protein [Nonomuraea muscovyensis]
MKGGALHGLTMALPYLPAEVVDQLARLVCLAVRREHRCEDVRYAVLARRSAAHLPKPKKSQWTAWLKDQGKPQARA